MAGGGLREPPAPERRIERSPTQPSVLGRGAEVARALPAGDPATCLPGEVSSLDRSDFGACTSRNGPSGPMSWSGRADRDDGAAGSGGVSAGRSVSRVLSRRLAPTGMAIHLRPPVTRRLMRPTRGLGSAPLSRQQSPAGGLRPPIWPCSGWSLPVSLRRSACAGRRHRHCGTGPRLAAGGRYPPPCAEELGLSSRRRGFPRRRATIRSPR
jgi:hypothetical protein